MKFSIIKSRRKKENNFQKTYFPKRETATRMKNVAMGRREIREENRARKKKKEEEELNSSKKNFSPLLFSLFLEGGTRG